MQISFKLVQPLQCEQFVQPLKLNKKLGIMSPNAPPKWEQLLLESTGPKSNHCLTKPAHVNRRWMEYQGIQNWEGLLDPLDENLRGEIIRYGHFADAAYKAFEFDSTSPSFATCRFPKKSLFEKAGLPKTGYSITKNLHASSGIELPRWTNRAPSWMSTKTSWIGYVAVCNDKEEIARLGRRDIVISLRGTATCLEWLENFRTTLTQLPNEGLEKPGPMVESGFLSLYTSGTKTRPSLQQLVREEMRKILQAYGDEPLSLTITGHSLGAALAVLTAYDIKTTFKNSPLATVISFGGPRVGNKSFRHHVENQGTKVLRIVNSDDVVTKVPGFLMRSDQVQLGNLPSWIEPTFRRQWGYVDVGRELRLSSRASPYFNQGFNVVTCHELNTYLHLVEGFVSSTCPFRATARKITNDCYKIRKVYNKR